MRQRSRVDRQAYPNGNDDVIASEHPWQTAGMAAAVVAAAGAVVAVLLSRN
jgi:ElaB/YqjD/DUF883 family membrane-anchored ribosome-binding protein